ncbi:hypothetical protein J6E39_02405 [bacterium]|nr:hypothetical protein [bacterium]
MVDVAQIQRAYNTMNASQQKDFLKSLGISDIGGVNLVNLFAAENYMKSHGIVTGLGEVSLFNKPKDVSGEIAAQADAKYKAADEKWNNWHAVLNYANKQESFFEYNAKTFLEKAKKSAISKGNDEISMKKSDDYKKYVTYTNSASDAYSLFKQALSGEQMAVADKKAANNLSAISMFYQG